MTWSRATRLQMQAIEADQEQVEGASIVRTLAPGQRFEPYDLSVPETVYEKHIVMDVTHMLVDHTYETDGGGTPDYANTFVALPARLPATPHQATHRPRLDGVQVAIVAGPPGEEIHTEEFGRVKLWFPWDRRPRPRRSPTRGGGGALAWRSAAHDGGAARKGRAASGSDAVWDRRPDDRKELRRQLGGKQRLAAGSGDAHASTAGPYMEVGMGHRAWMRSG